MNIVLGVSGGIAAYKAPDLVRRLREVGADVRVILTPNAARFVSALSLAAVSGNPVISDQWGDPSRGGVDHIEIARWADLLLVAPATANLIAKLTTGIADDALTTYAVAHRNRITIAPAMNSFMYRHATVQENLGRLRERGVEVLDPDSGLLACGDEGEGRMPDTAEIARWVARGFGDRDLDGLRILITAGPTREPIDPVRFISNRSSGRMGYALATVARKRGARVTLVSGPVSLQPPAGIEVESVTTSGEMRDAVMRLASEHDIVIKAAAVADWEAAQQSDQKIKKDGRNELRLELRRAPDILSELGALENDRPFLVAFAAETENVEENALDKLRRKNADMIVVNDVSDPAIGFDSDQNEVIVIGRDGLRQPLARASKSEIASAILDLVRSAHQKEDSPVG